MRISRFLATTAFLCFPAILGACSSDGKTAKGTTTHPESDGGKKTPGADDNDPAPTLPPAPAECPEFHEGMTTITSSGASRQFQIYIDDAAAAAKDGPIVFYWYGTGGVPAQAVQGLTADGIARIKDAGGIVIAPVHVNTGLFPWIQGMTGADYQLMDDIIGCAQAKVGIDARRVHSLGFSAGALFTAQLSFARSNYIASVALYSGGGDGEFADPSNLFAAMILYGGPNDMLVLKFEDESKTYYDKLTMAGHFAFECNHGGGHSIPMAGGSVVQFLMDHPFGTNPSPYVNGLPAGFPSYCTL